MFHSNAILASGLMILMISNLSECDKSAPIDSITNNRSRSVHSGNESVLNKQAGLWSSDKQAFCSTCAANCDTKNRSLDSETNEPVSNEDTIRTYDNELLSREEPVLDSKASSSINYNLKKRLRRMDMSTSIRTLLSRLRPESPLSAFGYTNPPPYSQTSYAPIANAYSYAGYRPTLSNLGVNYGLDISPGYSDHFTPYISTGLGSNLGTPYGTGLGIGSSFGIYDNFYQTNSFGTSKSTMLRRKLVPQEGVLLLEAEDPLNDPRETLPLTSGHHVVLSRNGHNNGNYPTNFGPTKFSIQLTNSPPSELNSEGKNIAFYGLSLGGGQPNPKQSNLAPENLANLDELSRNPHLSKLDRQTHAKIRILGL